MGFIECDSMKGDMTTVWKPNTLAPQKKVLKREYCSRYIEIIIAKFQTPQGVNHLLLFFFCSSKSGHSSTFSEKSIFSTVCRQRMESFENVTLCRLFEIQVDFSERISDTVSVN